MKLLEFFALLESAERLKYLADKYAMKIYQQWEKEVANSDIFMPNEIVQAMSNDILPDMPDIKRKWPNGEKWYESYVFINVHHWMVDWFADHDPTPNKKYTDWIIRQWLKDQIKLEDVSKLPGYLEIFDAHKKNLEKKDINQYKSYRDLANAVRELEGSRPAGEKVKNILSKDTIQQMMTNKVPDPQKTFDLGKGFDIEELVRQEREEGKVFDTAENWYGYWTGTPDSAEQDPNATTEIEVYYRSDRLAVLIPNTMRAACELGKGTEWCTAATKAENYFWTYAPEDELYVILTDKLGKFQFHFKSNQYADVHDNMLSEGELQDLVTEYPELKTIFKDQAAEYGIQWLISAESITPDFVLDLMHNVSNNPNLSNTTLMLMIPKKFNGQVDDNILESIESYIRKEFPAEAYFGVRNPTQKDLQNGIIKEPKLHTHTQQKNRAFTTIKFAIDNKIPISDETLEMGIAHNGNIMLYIPEEKWKQNPGWVLSMIHERPSVIMEAYELLKHGGGDRNARTALLTGWQAELIHETIVSSKAGKAAIENAIRYNPDIIISIGSALGLEPWKFAIRVAKENMDHNLFNILNTFVSPRQHEIPEFTPQQLLELFEYVIINDLWYLYDKPHEKTNNRYQYYSYGQSAATKAQEIFHTFEHIFRGKLPTETQKMMLNHDPRLITYLNNPDKEIVNAANVLLYGEEAANIISRDSEQ